MASAAGFAVAVAGLVTIVAVAALVDRDARRVGVGRPRLWAGLVAVSGGVGLGLFLFVPTVPLPGLLIVVLFGPVFYLFERDDAKHGDEPAEPGVLPDQAGGDRSSGGSSASDASETSSTPESTRDDP